MHQQRATRDSWPRLQPMPNTRVRLQVSQTFTDEEFQRIQMGFIPREMEDKWFIYFEGGMLFFHRSWTGICIYQVRLTQCAAGWQITEAWANGDPTQFTASNDTQLFLRTLYTMLLS